MTGLLRAILGAIRSRREARATEVMDWLKARYHTFRALLANNEQALALISGFGLPQGGIEPATLATGTEELLSVTFELVDGLNRLTDNRYAALYTVHQRLGAEVRHLSAAALPAAGEAPWAISLDDLGEGFEEVTGGKAWSLARLKRAGLPVPDGFVATTGACRRFLAASDLDILARKILRKAELGGDLESATREVVRLVLATPVPEDVAGKLLEEYERLTDGGRLPVSVRSSGLVEDRPDHSFAGQFTSVLNVTSPEGFLAAFKEVVASNFGPRPTAYRLHAGLPVADLGMAVLCQAMVPARAAGVLFTMDPAAPGNGRMLLSAVPGLGTQAVGGSAPADLYRPSRDGRREFSIPSEIADKTHRDIPLPDGGLASQEVPEAERRLPLLSNGEVLSLTRYGLMIESLTGAPQDIEWAVTDRGEIRILQARQARQSIPGGPADNRAFRDAAPGPILLSGGSTASPGRAVGMVRIVRSSDELRRASDRDGPPLILALHQGMVDAAAFLPEFEGVVVDLGNPADHLSCVAREHAVPMLTGLGDATGRLAEGQWIVLDAERGVVREAPEQAWAGMRKARKRPTRAKLPPELAKLRELIVPLNLTDAYGPTFSMLECRSLHDIVRYVHEMAVLAMFEAGDDVLEEADSLLYRLDGEVPLHFLLIDLGGGVDPGRPGKGRRLSLQDIASAPLAALCQGMQTPGLRWRDPAPLPGVTGLVSRSLLDGRSPRPVGNMNYGLITRDYLNLNARVDFHFAMVDAVCGPSTRSNYVRFRFKGGGTAQAQRERRARFVAQVLEAHGFFTDRQGDLVTASLATVEQGTARDALVMLGRLLGFSRLLDAAMIDDDMPRRVAKAFLDGDWGLEGLKRELAGQA